jgi:hypothetical protein
VKSGIEKDTAFYRGYLIDDRSLTSLRVALAKIVAERLSSATCSVPISIASNPLWALPIACRLLPSLLPNLRGLAGTANES